MSNIDAAANAITKQDAREVDAARDAYLNALERVAKRTGFGSIVENVDKLLQFGENIGCEGQVVDSNLLSEYVEPVTITV